MVALGACGGGSAGAASPPSSERARTTTTVERDDRRTVAYGLPDERGLGAGWVELNREPGGPDDPTLPTAPELGPDCGGHRAVQETGAAFALFERRRAADLDEEVIVYTLLFASEDDAAAQTSLYRSATFETGCVAAAFDPLVHGFGAVVDAADRPLPTLADTVDGAGRVVHASVDLDGEHYEGRAETTVLRSGRAVGLVLRFVTVGAPEPFTIDRFVADVASGLASIGDAEVASGPASSGH